MVKKDKCPKCGTGLHYSGHNINEGYKSIDDDVELFYDCPDCGSRYRGTYTFEGLDKIK